VRGGLLQPLAVVAYIKEKTMNKKKLIIIVLVTIIAIALFFYSFKISDKEKEQAENNNETEQEGLTKEEIEYMLSLPRGTVVSLGEDSFVVEIDYFRNRVKVNVTEDTKFVLYEESLLSFSIPEEYNDWWGKFYYVLNFDEKEYQIQLYFDTEENLGENKEKGILEVQEVTATFIGWDYQIKE
jgi:hypothetical protein